MAVIGCGGVGLSVVQGARLAGAARIVAIDVREDKAALAVALGATDALVGSGESLEGAFGDLIPDGADHAFDAIGRTSTTETAIRLLGTGGTALVVGLPPQGSRASFDPLALAEREQRILGSNYGGIRPAIDIPDLVDLVVSGDLDLESMVSARRPLEEAAAALADLDSGTALRQLLLP